MHEPVLDIFALRVATLGGIGRVGMAPGTLGTLATLPLCWMVMRSGMAWHLLVLAVVVVIGTWAAHRSARLLDNKDPKEVVVDEMAGMLLTMVGTSEGWFGLLVGFLAFRLFDIWKPWPVSWLDRSVPGGWGIMADDLAAGIYAGLVVTIVTFWTE
ncbi:MAG: phosphatidylglycerophosphatase A [Nitrospirae bacterium]|nr:phosphatidylglycerophosphatase A [Magnetococcales bacterium]HAT51465.1 phosphatidylglycerophosphatase A [Alphaproteobacteria bacterium]